METAKWPKDLSGVVWASVTVAAAVVLGDICCMASSYDPRLWCCDGVEGVEGMVEVELFLPSGVWVWVGGVLLVHVSKHKFIFHGLTQYNICR